MSDRVELYYAEMEAARNEAEDAYFRARPNLQRNAPEQALFRAGFERAFEKLWGRVNPIAAPVPITILPTWPAVGHGQATHVDCGCPPNHVCMNVACPRQIHITSCSAQGKS